MSTLFAFLHHLAAFTHFSAIAVEFALKAGQAPVPSERKITMIRKLLHGELIGVVIILLCAAIMARGGFV